MPQIRTKAKTSVSEKQRFEVLLEDVNGKFDLILENTSVLLEMKPKVDQLVDDVAIIKTDVEIMKGLLKRKVDIEEFEALVKRVAHLENKAHARI